MPSSPERAVTTRTLNAPTDSSVALTVNNWYEVSFAIEDLEAAQVKRSYTLMERYAKNAAYAIARKLDTALVTLFSNFTPSVGTGTASPVADSDIRSAIAQLDTANVDSEEAAFFFHPNTFWNQVQALDKFSLAINSPINDPTAKQPAAFLYGRKVFVSSQILNISGTEGRVNALAHPDALHFATSPLGAGGSKGDGVGSAGIRVQSHYIPEYLSTVTTADIAYGVVLNRATAGVRIMTQEQ